MIDNHIKILQKWDMINNYTEKHCWQYDIRLRNRELDFPPVSECLFLRGFQVQVSLFFRHSEGEL